MSFEAAKPFLVESHAASIVQIATITAIEQHDVPIDPSYGSSKAATIDLVAQIAQRLGGLKASGRTVCRQGQPSSRVGVGTTSGALRSTNGANVVVDGGCTERVGF